MIQNNLKTLAKYNKNLADLIKNSKKLDWLEVKNNNALIRENNQNHTMYDLKNPLKESKETAKRYKGLKENVTILLGIGLGHLAYQLLSKKEKKHIILIIEPESYIVREAFKQYDFSKWLEDGTLFFACPGKGEVMQTISSIDSMLVVEDWAIIAEKYILLKPDIYNEVTETTTKLINQIQCNTGTVIGAGYELARNDILNIPYIIRHHGIKHIKNIHRNKPAILVSTGPSLQKNIHLLREHKNGFIIIAVAQALRVLLAYGIRPDFICSVDFGKTNMGHFKGLMDSNIPLIVLNRTYDKILKKWQGPKIICATPAPGHENTVTGFMAEDKGFIEQGGSVAHLCLSSAVHMGCNPIIMLGQDLSYADNLSHIALVDENGTVDISNGNIEWKVKDTRSHLKNNTHSMGPVIQVPGYFGEYVNTNVGLASFITAFENLISVFGKTIFINCTEGGAKIKGALQMSLQSALNKYKKTMNKTKIDKYLLLEKNHANKIDTVLDLLKKDIEVLKNIIDNASLGLRANNKALKAEDVKEIKKHLAENEKYSNLANNYTKQNPLVSVAIYNKSRQIQNRKLNVKGNLRHILKNEDDFKTRIERNRIILEAAVKQSNILLKYYRKVDKILRAYINTKDETYLIDYNDTPPTIRDAKKLFKVGNWAKPLLDAKKIIDNRHENKENRLQAGKILNEALNLRAEAIKKAKKEYDPDKTDKILEYNKLVETARQIGRECKDYDTSLKLLQKAKKLCPEKLLARWGYATSLVHIGSLKKAIKEYEQLIEDFPTNKRLLFESGQVILQENFQKGMDLIKQAMLDTNEFDFFLSSIGQLYEAKQMYKEASTAYEEYLKVFPTDVPVMEKLLTLYEKLEETKKYDKLKKKLTF